MRRLSCVCMGEDLFTSLDWVVFFMQFLGILESPLGRCPWSARASGEDAHGLDGGAGLEEVPCGAAVARPHVRPVGVQEPPEPGGAPAHTAVDHWGGG